MRQISDDYFISRRFAYAYMRDAALFHFRWAYAYACAVRWALAMRERD